MQHTEAYTFLLLTTNASGNCFFDYLVAYSSIDASISIMLNTNHVAEYLLS